MRGEAFAEIGSGVITRDHEQIVKGADRAAVTGGAETLVQSVKKIGRWRAVLPEQAAGGIGGKTIGERAQEAMRAIAEQVAGFGMSAREAEQNFARVHADAREISAQAVGGVEGDFQSASIAVFAREVIRRCPSISSRLAMENCRPTAGRVPGGAMQCGFRRKHAESAPIPASEKGGCFKDGAQRLGGLNQQRVQSFTIRRNFHQRQQFLAPR